MYKIYLRKLSQEEYYHILIYSTVYYLKYSRRLFLKIFEKLVNVIKVSNWTLGKLT